MSPGDLTPFPLVELAELDSTSTHAAALLRAGRAAPFAVRADRQTGGRGRRGQSWESPPGNLYLTLVLPPPPPAALAGALPLKAAAIVARCLRRATGVRATLKWPNDVLFAGRKLAGLLLEGSAKGGEPGEVLVGIGLNVQSAPPLGAGAAYAAVSLAEITGRAFDAAALGRELMRAFAAEWDAIAADQVADAFEEFAPGPGHLWTELAPASGRGEALRAARIGDDGALVLGGTTLTSADHKYGWIYQGAFAGEHPLLLADVGNTATKICAFTRSNDASPRFVVAAGDDAELAAALTQAAVVAPARGWPLFYVSVNPLASQRLQAAAAAAGLSAHALPKRPLLRRGDGYRLSELGGDRLAAIEGHLAALPADRRGGTERVSLVVACGTATTIDAVRDDGEHLGGVIAPGIATSLNALHAATGLLPDVPASELGAAPARALASGTRGAMLQGALLATVGAVDAARLAVSAHEVVVTGGFASLVAPLVAGARAQPHLVLAGARAMALGGRLAP